MNHNQLADPIVRSEVARYDYKPEDPTLPSIRVHIFKSGEDYTIEAQGLSLPADRAIHLAEAIRQSAQAFAELANPQPDAQPDAGVPTEGAAENAGSG